MFRTYDGVAIYVPAFVCAGWLITFGDSLPPISFFHTRFIDLIEVTHRQIAASACFSIGMCGVLVYHYRVSNFDSSE